MNKDGVKAEGLKKSTQHTISHATSSKFPVQLLQGY